jgi:hypothetical protein
MIGYDGWKNAYSGGSDVEWAERITPTCEAELDYAPDGHECNDNCDFVNGYHSCGWNGKIEATCVGGSGDYTRYWGCPDCETNYADEVK